MIGIVGKEISALKGIDTGKIRIDVDKAGLYPATVALASIDGKDMAEIGKERIAFHSGTDLDQGVLTNTNMRFRSWSIYPTRDPNVWYQVLSNLHPVEFLKSYGLDADMSVTKEEAYEIIKAKMATYSAAELEQKNIDHGWCGQTCYTPEQWRDTEMGKRLQAHPMINCNRVVETPNLPPVPFTTSADKRPLAGIKVIEFARVIAGPAMGAALASLGADVIKVQSPNLPDIQSFDLTLTAGKRTFSLDLNVEDDKKKLRTLIEDVDVIIQAYRYRSLERRGFGLNEVLEMANKRGKGVVYLDLNCYGPDGYYAERPGYQQIADAASGCSYVCGKANGFEDGTPVLPSLPIADMLSGAIGVVDVMMALRDRAKVGGSYHAHVTLTAIDTAQLSPDVGLYPPDIVRRVQENLKFARMTPELHVEELLGVVVNAWKENSDLLGRDGYMSTFTTAFGKKHSILSPIVEYENNSNAAVE
ncbi:alpha methylacyl- racemase protein [Purpureocillium lilacinum]|uniref:Alpha methylacyl-racemase protein n=1 Tax=Purpureocillium lilacinum TaxID=33203 RepID=A0A179FUG0_PURLI|nr:alpha methylacyl- racemase protein [Purpureocillium lilacinum]